MNRIVFVIISCVLFAVLPAKSQNFSLIIGLNGGIATPNPKSRGNHLLKAGPQIGLELGSLYQVHPKIQIGLKAGISNSKFYKNTAVIPSDCFNPPFISYFSASDSLNGRDVKIMELPIEAVFRYRILPKGLYAEVGLGVNWLIRQRFEDFAVKDCQNHESNFIPANQDSYIRTNKWVGMGSVLLGQKLGNRLSIGVFSRFYFVPRIQLLSLGNPDPNTLIPAIFAIRLGLEI